MEPERKPVAVNGSAPSAEPAGELVDVDWRAARSESVGVLRERAQEGSVTAAAQLAKIANAEIRTAIPCEDHVTAEDFWGYVQTVFDLFKSTMQGKFARQVSLEFDVPLERIETLIEDVAADVAKELNARLAVAQEERNERH